MKIVSKISLNSLLTITPKASVNRIQIINSIIFFNVVTCFNLILKLNVRHLSKLYQSFIQGSILFQ